MPVGKVVKKAEMGPCGFDSDMVVLALATRTYRELSEIAGSRGQSVAEALQEAVRLYLDKK